MQTGVLNSNCTVRNLLELFNLFIVRGDQTSHAALGLRPSDVPWEVLGRQQGSWRHQTVLARLTLCDLCTFQSLCRRTKLVELPSRLVLYPL